MKKPNFFIIGAPKCGTTSISDWLEQHPEVSLARKPPVEPNFFNTDHRGAGCLTLQQYEALFADAGDKHIAVGEKSVWYLSSNNAVSRILDYTPDARFIVCVRNPIEMAYALHHEQAFGGIERLSSFKAAWEAQDERASRTGAAAAASTHLLYGPTCRLGHQVERLRSLVPSERIHLIFMDDIKRDPHAVYRGVLGFLGLAPFAADLRVVNEAKVRRFPFINQVTTTAGAAKRMLGIRRGFGMLDRVDKWNRVPQRWRPDSEMTQVLRSYFRDDIELLAKLTQRNLSHWLDRPETESDQR